MPRTTTKPDILPLCYIHLCKDGIRLQLNTMEGCGFTCENEQDTAFALWSHVGDFMKEMTDLDQAVLVLMSPRQLKKLRAEGKIPCP